MLVRLLTLTALATAIASGCGGSQDQAAPATETVQEAVTPSGRPPAPELTGTTLGGETVSLGDFRGRPVLVNVWSSW